MLAGRQGWLSPFGVSVISWPMELAHGAGLSQPRGRRLGSTGRYTSAPTHPQGPKPRLRSRGLLQDLSIWTLPPRGASQVDLAHRPQQLLACSGSTVTRHSAGPWVPRHLLLRVPLTTICLGCHGLPHAQEQGPGSPEADSPTGRTRKTYHCLLHDNRSCPHPPPLGSPSERPLSPGPLRVEGWPVRLKQKSLGPFTVLLTIIFLPAWSVTRFLEPWQPSQATRLRTDITSPEAGA